MQCIVSARRRGLSYTGRMEDLPCNGRSAGRTCGRLRVRVVNGVADLALRIERAGRVRLQCPLDTAHNVAEEHRVLQFDTGRRRSRSQTGNGCERRDRWTDLPCLVQVSERGVEAATGGRACLGPSSMLLEPSCIRRVSMSVSWWVVK